MTQTAAIKNMRRGKTGNSGMEGEGCGLSEGLAEGEDEEVADELGEGITLLST